MRVLKLITVRTLWAIADTVEIVRDGCIVAASKIATAEIDRLRHEIDVLHEQDKPW